MKLAGVDLSCDRGRAARNWRDDEDVPDGQAVHVDAGWSPVVVRLQTEPETWIGGAQAMLAPHGRGPGWGDKIGGDDRRLPMRQVLPWRLESSSSAVDATALHAAVDALTGDARLVALVIPDDGAVDEDVQDAVLRALRGPRRPRIELVWRPVATILGHIGLLPEPASSDAGTEIVVVSDLDGHLSVSRLRLRRLVWAGRTMLAPERHRAGVRMPWSGAAALRVASLRQQAAGVLGIEADALARQSIQAEAVIAVGAAPRRVIRMPNASWMLAEPPVRAHHAAALPEQVLALLCGADAVITESAIGPVATRALAEQLRQQAPDVQVIEAKDGATAAGALEVARRFAAGAAPWLDFLPGLDAVITDADGEAVFDSLIPACEVAPAGKFWVCATPPAYGLREGQTSIDLYFEKLDTRGVRRWTVTLPAPAPQGTVVRLRVQQRPATGQAAIMIECNDWAPLRAQPIRLDWKELTDVDHRDRAEILADLNPPARVPNRYYYPADLAHWNDGVIEAALEKYVKNAGRFNGHQFDALQTLYDRFKRQYPPGRSPGGGRRHAIDTDGTPPRGLRLDTEALWRHALQLAAVDVERIASGAAPDGLQEAPRSFYKFPTWCFTACPPSIVNHLAKSKTFSANNRLVTGSPDMKVLMHGIGRCMTGGESIVGFVDDVCSGSRAALNELSMACVAFLISRREEAAQALASRPDLVETLAQAASYGLRQTVGGHWGVSLPRYALELSLGLVRVRRYRRSTLTPRTGRGAEKLVSALQDLAPRAPVNRRGVVTDAIDWVLGQGANENILMALD